MLWYNVGVYLCICCIHLLAVLKHACSVFSSRMGTTCCQLLKIIYVVGPIYIAPLQVTVIIVDNIRIPALRPRLWFSELLIGFKMIRYTASPPINTMIKPKVRNNDTVCDFKIIESFWYDKNHWPSLTKALTRCADLMRIIANCFYVLVVNDVLCFHYFIQQSNHFGNAFLTSKL